MINQKLIDGLSEQLGQLFGTLNNDTSADASLQIRALLQGTLNRMDLVSREEFDAQSAVLARTRSQLEELQQQLDALEKSVQQ